MSGIRLGEEHARAALALAEHHAPRIKDQRTRAAVERLVAALRERLSPERARRRASELEATRRYRSRMRAAGIPLDSIPCPACGGQMARRSRLCRACRAGRRVA